MQNIYADVRCKDVNMLGHLLSSDERDGLQKCSVTVGYQLSYPDETISLLSPQECTKLKREGLYICMIKIPIRLQKCYTAAKWCRIYPWKGSDDQRGNKACKYLQASFEIGFSALWCGKRNRLHSGRGRITFRWYGGLCHRAEGKCRAAYHAK